MAKSINTLPTGKKVARRVGEQANRLRFVIWGGCLGVLTLAMVWLAVSSGGDQSYSVRSPVRGQTAGDQSLHAYAYQGLARLIRAEGLGGNSIQGNSPLGSVGLRILLEPRLISEDQEARRAFRDFLTQSDAPVLLVPRLRNSADRNLRLNRQNHLDKVLPKPRGGLGRQLNSDLGFPTSIQKHQGVTQGRALGATVQITDLVSFNLWGRGAKAWAIDGHALIHAQRVKNTEVYFLSDPDLLNNAGLAQAENPDFTLAFLSEIKRRGPVVFDNRDIRVGGASGFSFVGRLFDWPLGIFTGSVFGLGLVLFWFSFGRFGPMLRDVRHLEAGKETALEAAVSMLAGKGNNREILRRYLNGQTRQLSARLGGPKTGDMQRLRAWLDAIAKRRGVDKALRLSPIADLLNAGDPSSILSENQAANAAHTIHAFRKALIHDT